MKKILSTLAFIGAIAVLVSIPLAQSFLSSPSLSGTSQGRGTRVSTGGQVKPVTGVVYVESDGGFSALLTAIGTQKTLVVIDTEVVISANTAIPSNVTIQKGRGFFTVQTTKTLTDSGPVVADLQQLFSLQGTGAVAFTYGRTVYPEWFGAMGDSTTDDQAAINASVASLTTGTVFFSKKNYKVTRSILGKTYVNFEGRGTGSYLVGNKIASTVTAQGCSRYPYIRLTNVRGVRIDKLGIIGNGSWSASPFTCPCSTGTRVVGWNNFDVGVLVDGTMDSDITIANSFFSGLHDAIYLNSDTTTTLRLNVRGNVFINLGRQAAAIQSASNAHFDYNTVSQVFGSETRPNDTDTAQSKYADGVYFYQASHATAVGNIISFCRRIGIVIEAAASPTIRDTNIVISSNVLHDFHGHRGTELNAGIWLEGGKSYKPAALTGNTIYNSDQIGINAYTANITGGSIKRCASYGMTISNASVTGVSLDSNAIGIVAQNVDSTMTTVVQACTFVHNTQGGIDIEQKKGNYNITGNYFEDNGGGYFRVLSGGNYGVRVNRYYNAQKVIISGNSFISSADTGSSFGQQFAIAAVGGGDFTYTTDGIVNNTFIFTGRSYAYPNNLGVLPCSFTYDNTVVLFNYDLIGKNGNTNLKITQADLTKTKNAGVMRFLGYASAAPVAGTFLQGDYYENLNVGQDQPQYFVCDSSGTPGEWGKRGWSSNGKADFDSLRVNSLALPGSKNGYPGTNFIGFITQSADAGLTWNDNVSKQMDFLSVTGKADSLRMRGRSGLSYYFTIDSNITFRLNNLTANQTLYADASRNVAGALNSTATKKYWTQTSSGLPVWDTISAEPPQDIALTSAHVLVGGANNQAKDVAMSGDVGISNTGATTITGFSGLTASQPVFTDASKNAVSNAVSGSGNVLMSASPTTTGTLTGAIANWSGNQTITSAYVRLSNSGANLQFLNSDSIWATSLAGPAIGATQSGWPQSVGAGGLYFQTRATADRPMLFGTRLGDGTNKVHEVGRIDGNTGQLRWGQAVKVYSDTTYGTVKVTLQLDGTAQFVGGIKTSGVDTASGGIAGSGGAILISPTAPTISSGFGTSPSITANNGPSAFRLNVGTGGTASSGVIGLPAAATGWNCTCNDITTTSASVTLCKQTASTTTSATIENLSDIAVVGAWTASDILAVSCFAY